MSTSSGDSASPFPPLGHVYEVNFGEDFVFHFRFDSETSLTFTGQAGALKGFTETVATTVTPIRPGVFMVSWQEPNKTTVVRVDDYENGIVYTNITWPDMSFTRRQGTLTKLQ